MISISDSLILIEIGPIDVIVSTSDISEAMQGLKP